MCKFSHLGVGTHVWVHGEGVLGGCQEQRQRQSRNQEMCVGGWFGLQWNNCFPALCSHSAKPTRGRGLQGPDQPVYPFPGPWFPQDPHLIGRGVLGGRGGHLEASCSVPPTPDIPPPALHSLAPPTASPVSPSQLPLTRPGLALVPSDWRLGGQGGPEGREIWRWRDA